MLVSITLNLLFQSILLFGDDYLSKFNGKLGDEILVFL